MDKIIMRGMRFFGFHGVLPQEKELGQTFEVDVELFLDLEKAGQYDSVEDTVSYADVFEVVEQVITGSPLNLIEAVARRIADEVLGRFCLVEKISVVVKKPSAPIKGEFDYMGVEISRQRQGL